MNYKSDALEKKAWKNVNQLKNHYVIDILTAERLRDIFVYLFLSTASKNQRGINMHQNALAKVLQNLPVVKKEIVPAVNL